MQQIDFHFNVTRRVNYVARLIKKVVGKNLSVAVWSTDKALLKEAYDELWRFEDLTVIAHAWTGADYEADVPVLFGTDLAAFKRKDVLILLDENVPEGWEEKFQQFDRIVDIVSTDPTELEHSRARYKIYRASQVTLKAYDRSQG